MDFVNDIQNTNGTISVKRYTFTKFFNGLNGSINGTTISLGQEPEFSFLIFYFRGNQQFPRADI